MIVIKRILIGKVSGILIDGKVYYFDGKIKECHFEEFGKSPIKLSPLVNIDKGAIISRVRHYIEKGFKGNSHSFVMTILHDASGVFPNKSDKINTIINSHNFVKIK